MFRYIKGTISRNPLLVWFSFFWIAGLLMGSYSAIQTSTIHNSWTQGLFNSHLSVVGLIACLTLPFLLSAILFRMSLPGAVIPVIFLKAFSFSFCASSLVYPLHYSGWLLRLLFLFSDSVLSVPLLLFVMRNIQSDRNSRHNDLLRCLVLILVIGCIDSFVVSPFGVSLLS